MRVKRLEHIPGFNIDRVAAAAGGDPDVPRMENLDTDRHVRFVFSNEPMERLTMLGDRVRAAVAAAART